MVPRLTLHNIDTKQDVATDRRAAATKIRKASQSHALGSPECKTSEQMRMANAFCRYLELTERL